MRRFPAFKATRHLQPLLNKRLKNHAGVNEAAIAADSPFRIGILDAYLLQIKAYVKEVVEHAEAQN